MDGLGNINWWGFSPSIDLLDLYAKHCPESIDQTNEEKVINVLLVNAGDQRHLLNTIAYRLKNTNKNGKIKFRFYVYEKMLELYARDFLLLSLAIEHPSKRGIQEKTELFLEIFGNLFLRDYTSQYIQSKANEFIKCITDFDYLDKINLKLFDFSLLKFKERDFLEGIFKYWRLKAQQDKDPFPADKCWELRLRTYLGTRFDSRSNCFDWDYSMKLIDRKNCSVINNKIYSKWRDTGVAFELRDTNYDRSNKTLASGMVFNDPRNGDKTSRRGYFGDIIIGPFLSYGIQSENEEFFKKQNEYHRYTSMDVARSNLNKMMQSIIESSGLDLKKYQNNETIETKISELKITEVIEEENEADMNEETKTESIEDDFIKLDDCKIIFLPLTAIQDFNQKPKYDNYFDIVYFSNSGVTNMNQTLKKILKSNSLILFETAKYMIEMKNEQIQTFSQRLKEIGKENNFIDLNNYDNSQPIEENGIKKIPNESLDYFLFKNKIN